MVPLAMTPPDAFGASLATMSFGAFGGRTGLP
jgi:hypothetical protein